MISTLEELQHIVIYQQGGPLDFEWINKICFQESGTLVR